MSINVSQGVQKDFKWQKVLDQLKQKLESGEFSFGNSFYSLKQLCEIYGISSTTAKRVFQELKREGWILPTRKKGTIVNRHFEIAEIFFVGKPGIAKAQEGSGIDWLIYNRVMEGLRSREEILNLKIVPVSHDFFLSHLEKFRKKEVVVTGSILRDLTREASKANQEIVDELKSEVNPIVVHAFEGLEGFTRVGPDYWKGIHLAVEYLLKKEHRRIAFVSGDVNSPWFYPRFRGYMETLREHNADIDLELVKTTSGRDKKEDWEAVQGLLNLSSPPTAIVCGNDTRALHLLEYCKENRIRVPENMAITGFDNAEEAGLSNPPLTTVDTKMKEQGEKALELILEKRAGILEDPTTIKLDPELIIRNSA